MLALLLEYDGTNFSGWQIQPNARTVQGAMEDALTEVLGTRCSVIAAGRTDAGVHARGQVVHVVCEGEPHAIPLAKIPVAVNTHLPRDVRVRKAALADDAFHARYQALSREYRYVIADEVSVFSQRFAWTPHLPYNKTLLGEALGVFVGTHNFTSVSKLNTETENYVCTVDTCAASPTRDGLEITIRANRFVYGMCRGIIGAAITVARGVLSVAELQTLLAEQTRVQQPPMAPPHGLRLHCVRYPNGIFEEL